MLPCTMLFVHLAVGLICPCYATYSRTQDHPSESDTEVMTNHGSVVGFKRNVLGKTVYHYLGIPYARPPINNLRFKHPLPLETWKGVKRATKLPSTCFQSLPEPYELTNPATRIWTNNTAMSEDCLYLNIWTTKIKRPGESTNINAPGIGGPQDKQLNVMVWIHGGGFTRGSSTLDIYDGSILAAKMGVVVVSMQYRVGPFGFLYTDKDEIPGNQGLMDQLEALKWVHSNIKFFGGKPQRVTLFGGSAGAISVSLHLVSPLSEDYFYQAILQSGSAFSPWAYETTASAINKANTLASICGCHVSTSVPNHNRLLAECLRSLDPNTLVLNQWQMQITRNEATSTRAEKLRQQYRNKFGPNILNNAGIYFDIPFKPVVTPPFLTDEPQRALMIKKGKPGPRILLGVNKDEGLYHLMTGLRMYFRDHDEGVKLPEQFSYGSAQIDPLDLIALYVIHENYIHSIFLQAAVFEYQVPSAVFGSRDWTSRQVVDALDDFTGDFMIKCPVINFANAYSKNANNRVFMYSFEHRTENISWPEWAGVLHGQEVEYVFGMPFSESFQKNYYKFTDAERKLSENIMLFWTNFAGLGSPNLNPQEYNIKTEHDWTVYSSMDNRMDTGTIPLTNTNIWPAKDHSHMVLDIKLHMERNLRRHQCTFWREILPKMSKTLLADPSCRGYPDPPRRVDPIPKPKPETQPPDPPSILVDSSKRRNDYDNSATLVTPSYATYAISVFLVFFLHQHAICRIHILLFPQ